MDQSPSSSQPDLPSLRASDSERDETIERLTAAVGEGRLTLEEYSERSETALSSGTLAELRHLTADLPQATPPRTLAALGSEAQITAILGNESRKGHWTVPSHLKVRSVLGDCHLELQQANLQASVTTIEASAWFGSVTIFVPEGIEVHLSGRSVLGAKSSELSGTVPPGAPVLEVHCDVFCGSVSVRRPRRSLGQLVTRAREGLTGGAHPNPD